MKLNAIVLYLSVALVVVWMLMKYKSEGYSKDDLDAYIIEKEVLDPGVVRDMASTLTTDREKLDQFYTLAGQDDRFGLFKMTAEF